MKTLVTWNAGSSSLKVTVIRWSDGVRLAEVRIERIGLTGSVVKGRALRSLFHRSVRVPDHAIAARLAADFLASSGFPLRAATVSAHRIVYGGNFRRPVRLDSPTLKKISAFSYRAPLHLPIALAVVRSAQRLMPSVAQYGCFDTSAFVDLPAVSAFYPIETRVSRRNGIRRFGYHGLSHAAALAQAAAGLRKPASRVSGLTVHLGSGCSVAAFERGRPVDTSMGLTPLEGLMMGTRAGDLDSGIVLDLWRTGWSRRRVEELLERRSGVLGVSGYSPDLRDVLFAAGNPVPGYRPPRRPSPVQRRNSKLALSMFVYRVRKYLGAYAAILRRVDAVVFTGAAGSGNASLRRMILSGLRLPGRPRVFTLAPDEEGQMWREVRAQMR